MVCWQDELFKRYLPVLSRLIQQLIPQPGHTGRWFRGLVAFAQWQSERENRRMRLETVKRDRKWLETLGFVGKAKK